MAEAPAPRLQGPTSKERKYDRQLRLWGASGQKALEESHVLLVQPAITVTGKEEGTEERTVSGTGAVGVEALKNLVLPGIGKYTIVDAATVTEEDLGVNFFLEEESLGRSRAEETCRLLQELNPDVNGNFISKSIETLLKEPDFLTPYNLILLVAPVLPKILEKISKTAQQRSIPVFYIHCVGFYSAFSIQLPAKFPIVDTHPDPASTQDLRLLRPWPELSKAAEHLKGLDEMNDHEHGHVPYILLLLHYLEKWKEEKGELPETYKEKTAFREMLRAGTRTQNAEGGEENYDEAVATVLKSVNLPSLPGAVREMFELEECVSPSKDSTNFWVIASAIRGFYKEHGDLPLSGTLPDMKAQSVDYIKLQNIYKTKARQDATEVAQRVREIEQKLGRETAVPHQEIETFCKNAAHIKIIFGTPIPTLQSLSEKVAKKMAGYLSNPESLFPIWLSFFASDEVCQQSLGEKYFGASSFSSFSSSPPLTSSDESDDASEWQKRIDANLSLIKSAIKKATLDDEDGGDEEIESRVHLISTEMQRARGGELHNIAALTGGIVAQEAIKAITKQYIPADNTCIFDGVTSRSEVLKL